MDEWIKEQEATRKFRQLVNEIGFNQALILILHENIGEYPVDDRIDILDRLLIENSNNGKVK